MIRPIHNNVLVKPAEAESKTAGGILIADTAKEKPLLGEVIAIGEVKNIKVGDTVYYKAWGGNEVKFNGQEYLIIEDKDILAINE
jgi:chaperonin GroES